MKAPRVKPRSYAIYSVSYEQHLSLELKALEQQLLEAKL